MEEVNDLVEQRLKKLSELRALGVEPYDGRFVPDSTAREVAGQYDTVDKEQLEELKPTAMLAGRLMALRDFGKATFGHIQDATGRIQIYLRKDILKDAYGVAKKLDVGDIVGVRGRVFRTRTDELTVEVAEFVLLSKSLRPLPEKWHGLKDIEVRYRQRYLDLIVNPQVKEIFERKSAIVKALRDFLESRGFIEVDTPMMHQIPGGATARPFKTHHNALGIDLYLRIAPELYLKRLLVGGYERVYELNKNFRNEGISTRHNPEFTMLEFYTAYRDYRFLMDLTEEMLSSVAVKAAGSLKILYGEETIDLTPPWPRIPMLEALVKNGVPADME